MDGTGIRSGCFLFGGNLGLFSRAFSVQVTIERFATKTFSFSVLRSLAWILGQEKRKQRYKMGFRKTARIQQDSFPWQQKTQPTKSTHGFKSWKCVYPQSPEVSPICIQHFQRQIWDFLDHDFTCGLNLFSAQNWLRHRRRLGECPKFQYNQIFIPFTL